MLKGDLVSTPLAEVLTTLAETEATGCLHIDPGDGGDEALVYLKAGLVYSAHVPGRRPQLGARLVSGGALPPEALEEALEAQQTELHGWRLGELLVHLGYVEGEVVESFVIEQLRQAAFDLIRWREGAWKFRKNEKTREDVGGRSSVADLLAEAERRRAEWERIRPVVQGPDAVPMLSSAGSSAAEMTLDQDQWALLCKVDGERSMAQLARDCGFTTYEAAEVIHGLISAGLLEVEELPEDDGLDDLPPDEEDDEDAEPLSTVAALSSAIALLGGTRPAAGLVEAAAPDVAEITATDGTVIAPADSADVAAAGLVEVAAPDVAGDDAPAAAGAADEWADLLVDDGSGDAGQSELGRLFSFSSGAEVTTPDADVATPAEPPTAPRAASASGPKDDPLAKVSEALDALLAGGLQPVDPPQVVSLAAVNAPAEPAVDEEELQRVERSRAAAAAELAEAHAFAEQSRRHDVSETKDELESLVAALREPSETATTDHADAESAADAARATAEAERVEADRLEAERVEADRLEAERLEAERLDAERVAAEEAQRAVEEAERLAAEEQARVEAAAEAAHQAAREAARAAELAEMDRLAREEADREAGANAQAAADALAAELAGLEAISASDAAPGTGERADAAGLLRDFTATAPEPAPAPAPEPEPEPEAAKEPAPMRPARTHENDTASLLRELSSLGFDDDKPTPPPPAQRPSTPPGRPAAPPREQPKKRKGLFGR